MSEQEREAFEAAMARKGYSLRPAKYNDGVDGVQMLLAAAPSAQQAAQPLTAFPAGWRLSISEDEEGSFLRIASPTGQELCFSAERGTLRAQLMQDMAIALIAAEQPKQQAAQPVAWGDVLAERRRQVEVEGWHATHDDEHDTGALSRAAAAYTMEAASHETQHPGIKRWLTEAAARVWPWTPMWWKPADTRRMLVKAGALVLAEIERLDRAAEQPKQASKINQGEQT